MMEIVYPVLFNMVATSQMRLLNTYNVASTTEELSFKFYLILIHLNLYSHMWTMATIVNSAATHLTFEKVELCNIGILKKKQTLIHLWY